MRKRPTRKSMALWLAVLVAAAVCGAASDAMAQTPYVPYFGKNLVRYDRFDWQIYTTEHFQIYYYPRSSSTSSGWRATPRAPTSRSAPS